MEFIDLKKQYEVLKERVNKNIQNVLNHGSYIMGKEVKELEKKLEEYVGVNYCISCANGTDALLLSLMSVNIKEGDAVFLPSFTFFASAEVVSNLNATPIFIDVNYDTFNIDVDKLEKSIEYVIDEKKLNPKAIIAVDLFGLPAQYKKIQEIAKKYNLILIEDAAQGFGGAIDNKKACSFGDISTTSFFPAKPLGCYGDGGAIFTNNKEIYELLCSLRVHGKGEDKYDNVRIGMNSRLDTIQANILLVKLEAFREYELEKRQLVSSWYNQNLKNIVKIPLIEKGYISSYAQYTIKLNNKQERDFLQEQLKKEEIPSMIYYTKAMHQQTVYKEYKKIESLETSEILCKTCLSLPMHPYMEKETVEKICEVVIKKLEEFRNGR